MNHLLIIKIALKNEQSDGKTKSNKTEEIKKNNNNKDSKDYQLVRALDLVKSLYIFSNNDNNHFIKQEKSETKEAPKESKK